eukprot:CAMPEP_0196806444 /NCGR_PEP_ID=MMETSP1362-20130617/6343_1 /TAXON_ID=163516 /ORGANISM="Leptocylindrus danicus, Strain CCMP1856" /LENGTH=594 /DNA_ID=CAMNT_0042179925 /DNA_START=46 /DNA_END=1830 /DNA_ORIENTATION=+
MADYSHMCKKLTTCHECAGEFVKDYIDGNPENDNDDALSGPQDGDSPSDSFPSIISDNDAAELLAMIQRKILRRQRHRRIQTNGDNNAIENNSLKLQHQNNKCKWNTRDNTCSWLYDDDTPGDVDEKLFLKYIDECPLSPEYPSEQHRDDILPVWMGYLREHSDDDAFGQLTYFDLSLPGSHDAITYDLSLTISDGALDDNNDLSRFLHDMSGGKVDRIPHDLSDVVRWYSKTQQLDIVQQLNNGVRFIDFRIMAQRDADKGQVWMNLHFLQSKNAARHQLQLIRQWADEHPTEIVTIWLSRHGATQDTGQDQYPDVTIEQKQAFWNDVYCPIFDGVMIDATQTDLLSTPLSVMLERNHRVVTFATDYVEFTNSSVHALDARRLDNTLLPGVTDVEFTQYLQRDMYRKNDNVREYARARGHFVLLSLASSAEEEQILSGLRKQFGMFDPDETGCALSYHIPGMTEWCPDFCLDTSQLQSYYNQAPMEDAHSNPDWGFPNMIYLDAVDVDGTIRTGTQVMFGHKRSDNLEEYWLSRYAFVDTLLAYNLGVACSRLPAQNQTLCDETLEVLEERRSRYPVTLWDEPKYGRHADWPL